MTPWTNILMLHYFRTSLDNHTKNLSSKEVEADGWILEFVSETRNNTALYNNIVWYSLSLPETDPFFVSFTTIMKKWFAIDKVNQISNRISSFCIPLNVDSVSIVDCNGILQNWFPRFSSCGMDI